MGIRRKAAASLVGGDRIFRTRGKSGRAQVVTTVDTVQRLRYGVVRIYHGRHGLQYFDAAGTHLFDLPPLPVTFEVI